MQFFTNFIRMRTMKLLIFPFVFMCLSTFAQLQKLNISYMNRGYFYASLNSLKNEIGSFESASKDVGKFPEGFSLIVETNQVDTLNGKYEAYKVYIVNRTNAAILFSAQDNRLDMTVQAKDTSGKWKDIEYLQSSWCGNSYHTLTLNPEEYWSFKTPIYEGEIKTKLRIKLEYISNKRKVVIYSDEYDGSVNEGQFWNKMASRTLGIMNPY